MTKFMLNKILGPPAFTEMVDAKRGCTLHATGKSLIFPSRASYDLGNSRRHKN